MKPLTSIFDERPPANPEAEAWVVGSILLKPGILDDLGFLQPGDFHDATLSKVFGWLHDRHRRNEPIDIGLLKGHFDTDDWAARIAEIVQAVPMAAHAPHYARIVARLAKFRQLREIGIQTLTDAHAAEGEPDEVLERAETKLANIGTDDGEGEPIALAEAAVEATLRIDSILERGHSAGVLTGLETLDRDQGGLFPGELTILAARPGCGKTSLALQIANHNAERGRLVYLASQEMSAAELSLRLACGESGVSNRLVRTGQIEQSHVRLLGEALRQQSQAAMDIHNAASLTVARIRREIRKRKKHGLTLAVVDYLQLLEPEDRRLPREQQVARMVRGLKQIAVEYKIPILCYCQLNREAAENEVPQLSHLRESGAIEQDADVVWFLNRHEPKCPETHNSILTLAKNRNGETGPLRLIWDGPRTRFSCPRFEEFAEFGD